MRVVPIFSAPLLVLALAAQQPTARYAGAVAQCDTANRALLLRLDAGGERWVAVPRDVDILRIVSGENDIGKASKLLFEDVQPGDRVVARSDSQVASVAVAFQVLVLSHSEFVRRQMAERAEWKARGVTGRVTNVDPDRGEIIAVTAPRPIARTIVIRVSGITDQRRYRPDSARYTDAVPATLASVRQGDHVQALGEIANDGTTLNAEKLVSGSFRSFVATILRLDGARRFIMLQPATGGEPLAVRVGPAATLRRLRPEHAAILASVKAAKPGQARQPGADPQSILDSSPSIALEDLKTGDAVIVAIGGNGEHTSPLPALAVIAGAEPLLKRSGEAQKELVGSWDLTLDPGEPGGRGGN